MNSSLDFDDSVIHYFVDEAGDPTLFKRKGKVLIGNEGCSKFFILGKLDVDFPEKLSYELNKLRIGLLADTYFKNVPSFKQENRKTALAFHAKDDLPEVRREVYQLLASHEVRFYAVIRDKRKLVESVKQNNRRNPSNRYRPNELYDAMVSKLFCGLHRTADQFHICFAKRGNRSRTEALKKALEIAELEFERNFGFKRESDVHITAKEPRQSAGLQAVDYFLWALQRFYEKEEDRYIEMLWPKVGEIIDLDFRQLEIGGTYFRAGKPLNKETRPL